MDFKKGFYSKEIWDRNLVDISDKWNKLFVNGISDQCLIDKYTNFGLEKAIGAIEPDLKSFLQFSINDNSHPLVIETNQLTREIIERNIIYFNSILHYYRINLDFINLDSIITRVSHYVKKDKGISEIVNQKHKDIDLFTIIYPPTEAGLQVNYNNEWKTIDNDRKINFLLGEMIDVLSINNENVAIEHRVELESHISERVSITVFINANLDLLSKIEKDAFEKFTKRLNKVKHTPNNK